MKQLLNDEQMFELCISAGDTEKLLEWETPHAKVWFGPTTWKDMLDNALSDTVNWQTRKWSSFTKFQVFDRMTINSSRKNSNLLVNCQKFVHKLS